MHVGKIITVLDANSANIKLVSSRLMLILTVFLILMQISMKLARGVVIKPTDYGRC